MLAQRWFAPDIPQIRRTWLASLGCLIWLIPAWGLVWIAGIVGAPNLAPAPDAVLWLVITSVLSTALGGVLWNLGVAHAGLAAGALWQNAVPVFGVLIAMLFGFAPTGGQVLGGAIVLAGVFTMQWRRLRQASLIRSRAIDEAA
jgi:drug/metabolite transporter (DMT)-like permease